MSLPGTQHSTCALANLPDRETLRLGHLRDLSQNLTPSGVQSHLGWGSRWTLLIPKPCSSGKSHSLMATTVPQGPQVGRLCDVGPCIGPSVPSLSPHSEDWKVKCIQFSTWQLLIINAWTTGSSSLCHVTQKIYGHFESGFEMRQNSILNFFRLLLPLGFQGIWYQLLSH